MMKAIPNIEANTLLIGKNQRSSAIVRRKEVTVKMLRKLRNKKGFTLIELMVVIVVIGILAGIAIPRFMGAQDRARIGAAESDVNSMRQALGLYEIDHSSYDLGSPANYAAFEAALVDPDGDAYMVLPDTSNFTGFAFTGNDTTYTITVNARDNAGTQLTGTPEGVTH